MKLYGCNFTLNYSVLVLLYFGELRKYVNDAPKKSYILEDTVCTQKYVRARKYKHERKCTHENVYALCIRSTDARKSINTSECTLCMGNALHVICVSTAWVRSPLYQGSLFKTDLL
jgi:hypothetical protein